MLQSRLAAVALPILLASLTGCTKTIDTNDVEKKVSKTLSAQLRQKVKTKCPGTLEAKKGKTYICTAVAADGSKTRISLRMLDDSGRFGFEGAGPAGATR